MPVLGCFGRLVQHSFELVEPLFEAVSRRNFVAGLPNLIESEWGFLRLLLLPHYSAPDHCPQFLLVQSKLFARDFGVAFHLLVAMLLVHDSGLQFLLAAPE